MPAQGPQSIYQYSDPSTHYNMVPIFQGRVLSSQTKLEDDRVVENTAELEVTGNLQPLSNTYQDVTTKTCPYQFGGIACGVALTPLRGIITALTSSRIDVDILDPVTLDMRLYRYGTIKFVGGRFVGQEAGIVNASFLSGFTYRFNLFVPLRKLPLLNTPVYIANGCDQSLTTCHNDYNNILRTRALPFLQGGKVFLNADALKRNP
jgi:hypothetical protein